MNAKETLKGRAAARILQQRRPRGDVDKTKRGSPGSWPELLKRRSTATFCFMFLAFLVVASVFAAGENLVLNPSLEQGYSGPDSWSLNGNAYWSSQGHSGIHSVGVNATGSDGWIISTRFQIDENATYQFEFWVKGTFVTGQWTVQARWFTNADVWLGQVNYLVSGSYSEWTLVNDTVTPAATTAKSDIMIYAANSPQGDLIFDDFSVKEIVIPESEAKTWLDEMLFGSGFWLFIIIILAIIFVTVWAVPYSGAIFLPVCVFLAFEYFSMIEASSNHMWGAILMLFASIYIIIVMAVKLGSKK